MKWYGGRNELVISPMVLVWAIGEMMSAGRGNCKEDGFVRVVGKEIIGWIFNWLSLKTRYVIIIRHLDTFI